MAKIETKDQEHFLQKKWNHIFNVFFDVNKNKVLEWEDFELLSEIIRESRGEDDYDSSLVVLKKIWASLLELADTDHDNQVSADEWTEMWRHALKTKNPPEWEKLYLEYTFNILDSTGDGLLDLSEYIEVMLYYGISREEATQCFDMFAKDELGHLLNAIDYRQYCALWREYFESENHQDAGNYLFGIIQ